MKEFVTPKQVARAIGVSESSLKRWCDKGLLPTVRTAGGHRRLRMQSVLEFLRQTQQHLVRPEVLGLPAHIGAGETTLERARREVMDALLGGDEERCRRIVLDLYLSGQPLCEICDRVLAAAFHTIGEKWAAGEADVYQERRGCEITIRVLCELRSVLPATDPESPMAVGGTLAGDPYQLPTLMVELALREVGWRAQSCGTGLPACAFKKALKDLKPRLFWLSVSHIDSIPRFLEDYNELFTAADAAGIALIVGGRALTEPLRKEMRYSAYCDTIQHGVDFVRTLSARPRQESE